MKQWNFLIILYEELFLSLDKWMNYLWRLSYYSLQRFLFDFHLNIFFILNYQRILSVYCGFEFPSSLQGLFERKQPNLVSLDLLGIDSGSNTSHRINSIGYRSSILFNPVFEFTLNVAVGAALEVEQFLASEMNLSIAGIFFWRQSREVERIYRNSGKGSRIDWTWR